MKGKLIVQNLQKRRYHKRMLKKVTRNLSIELTGRQAYYQKKRLDYILVAKTPVEIAQKQLESARKYLMRHLKSKARRRLTVFTFPVLPDVRKPQEIRMGKGKGQKWVDNIEKAPQGKTLFGYKGRLKKLLYMFKSKLYRGVVLLKFKI